jgi:integrase
MNSLKLSPWYKWSVLSRGSGKHIFRRYRKAAGRIVWQTLPAKQYSHLSKEQLVNFVESLNKSNEDKHATSTRMFNYDTSFISKATMKAFEDLLRSRVTREKSVVTAVGALEKYVLKYFLVERKVANPNHWRQLEDEWQVWLANKKISVAHRKRVIQNANKFLAFLFKREICKERIVFEQVARRLEKEEGAAQTDRKKHISEVDWVKIKECISDDIKSHVQLAYYYGLRRAEVLGVKESDLFEECLAVNRQLSRVAPKPAFVTLKSKESREVPHWLIGADACLELILNIESNIMHPDTLGDLFLREMQRLKLPFQFHDLRRTWIANAVKKHHWREVQKAAGHSDFKTT